MSADDIPDDKYDIDGHFKEWCVSNHYRLWALFLEDTHNDQRKPTSEGRE
jgi:hypothetical protein